MVLDSTGKSELSLINRSKIMFDAVFKIKIMRCIDHYKDEIRICNVLYFLC